MSTRDLQEWLFAALVFAAIAVGSGGVVATVDGGPQAQTASCTASPTTVAPNETVTLDASNSDASFVEFDKEGDGTYERGDDTDFVENFTYAETGTYDPVVRTDEGTTASCGTVTVTEPPAAELSLSPNPAVAGESVTFDASGSFDPDGEIVEYRWDSNGDGDPERITNTSTTQFTYSQARTYVVSVTVVDEDGATDTAERDLVIEEAPTASCFAEPTSVAPGETVRIDATASENANLIDYDTDGDGEYEVFEETVFTYDAQAPDTSFTPAVRVYQDSRETADVAECGTVTVDSPNEPPEPAFSVTPRPGIVGQPVTFNGSASTDPDGQIVAYRWDFDDDGTVDNTTTSARVNHTYAATGGYVPTLTVVDDDNATSTVESDYTVQEPPPELRCRVEPRSVSIGDGVFIDASESTNVDRFDYDTDGDGEYERLEAQPGIELVYERPGTYEPQVRVSGGERVEPCGTVTVEAPNEPPEAAFTVDPAGPTTGDQVTFDGSASTDPDGQIVAYRWDFDGDGTVDATTNTSQVDHTYTSTGSNVPTLTVVDDDNATDTAERDLFVETRITATPVTTDTNATDEPADEETSEDPSSEIPWLPVGVGGGLAGLGGLLWYFFGGGGGGAGGPSPDPKPKPKPKATPGSDDTIRYETGVFALPTTSGTVSVPVGFEPDFVFLTVKNGARTDVAVDRTAGGTFGLVHATGDGLRNQCLTVADDSQSTDQATCAVADDVALQLVRHSSSGPLGRVTGEVASTHSTGFDLDVVIPGDDPLAGGVRVLYQAFAADSDVSVEVGHFMTPTEPGTQTVEFGIDADYVSLTTSAAVSDTDQLWTTNTGVGLSVGNAAAGDSLDQTAWGASAWPETDHTTAAVCRTDRALHLLYQDGDRVAGRTSASVTDLGTTLRLQYDRVYNGPYKLGSTARHPVSYLAMTGGEKMRPAVGAFTFPDSGEVVSVDCGFEPALVEFSVVDAPVGEEVGGRASSRPFDVSRGTAIDTGDGLRQYVVHHSVVAEPPAARSDVPTADTGATGGDGTAADGGRRQSRTGNETTQTPAGTVSPDDALEDSPTRDTAGSAPTADIPSAAGTETGSTAGDSRTAPDPAESADDGRVGLWLPQAPDGTILGRDELRVGQLTARGFDVTAESFDTDSRSGSEALPTVVYRAWPAVDGERGSDSGDDGSPGTEGSEDATTTGSRQTGPESGQASVSAQGDATAGTTQEGSR
jgi:PKD repeat protein